MESVATGVNYSKLAIDTDSLVDFAELVTNLSSVDEVAALTLSVFVAS